MKKLSELSKPIWAKCDNEQYRIFREYAVEPYTAPILRYGELSNVVVVARRGRDVIYWEDVEEGFNASPLAKDGRIIEHRCNQDELGLALNIWIGGRCSPKKIGPATSTDY